MNQIAYEAPQEGAYNLIHDPFIAVVERDKGEGYDICALDRQPVIAGAAYRYVIVRFGADGEMDRLIPTNIVEIQ